MTENVKLLIIDDSPTSLNILERILNSCGYSNVNKASGAWEGIELLNKWEEENSKLPDLILMDVIMPQMNGIEAIERLKTHPVYEQIPVIIISIKNDAQTLTEAFSAGASDFISKPVSRHVLKARVDSVIRLKLETDERKKQEIELKKLNVSLNNLNEMKNRFLGTAAHDLRGPLASVRGFAEMLLDELEETINPEQKEMLKMIQEISHGMLSLVNDLLDFSVIESGKLHLFKQEHNLKTILERRLHVNEMIASKKNIKIVEKLDDTVGNISIDKNRFDQIIDNLIGNAVKFSPQNTTITVRLYKDGAYAVITVEDQGVGINEEDIPKLFREYGTSSGKPTEGEKSTGLGLFIVKNIINAHNGVLSVKSTKGKGTEVTVKLPLEKDI